MAKHFMEVGPDFDSQIEKLNQDNFRAAQERSSTGKVSTWVPTKTDAPISTPNSGANTAADAFKPAPALAGVMLGSMPVNDKALDFDYSLGQTPANSFQSNALSQKGQEMKSNRWSSIWGWLQIIGDGLSGGAVSAKDMQSVAETTKESSAAAKSAKAEYKEMRETDPLYLAKQAENEARKDYYRILSAARQSGYINVSADEVDEAKAKLDAAAKEVERLGGVSNTSPFATWIKGAAESVAGGVKTAAGWIGNAYKYRAETMPKLWDATFGDEEEKAEAEKVYDEAAERANNANALMKSGFNTLEQANADTAMAKYGESEGKQVLIDIGTQAIPMAGDIALNAVAPGSGLAAMGVRSFGSGVYEAAQQGADFATQGAYGAATAAVEVLTEKMFDAFGGLAYGKGASDVLVDALVARLAGTPVGRTAWRLALNATGEGFEEFVSGVAGGFLDIALLNADPSEAWDPAEIAYEFFIGTVMGFFGAGPTMISGANIRAEAVSEFFAAQAKEGKTFKEAIAAYRYNEEKVNAVAAIRLAARQNGMGPMFTSIAENLLGDEAKADVVKAFQSIAAGVLYDEESQSYKMAAEMAASLNDAVKGNGSIVEAYKNIDAKDLLALRNTMEAEREKYGPKDLTEEDNAALTEVIQPEATVVKTEVTTLTKAGIDVTEATAIAQMIDSIVGGKVPSKNSVSKVLVGERVFGGAQDMAVKALFEQMTGKHIPEGATTKAQLKALYMTAIQEYAAEKQAPKAADGLGQSPWESVYEAFVEKVEPSVRGDGDAAVRSEFDAFMSDWFEAQTGSTISENNLEQHWLAYNEYKQGKTAEAAEAGLDALPAMEYDDAAKFRDEQLAADVRESETTEKSNPRPDKVLRFSDGAVLDRAGFYAQMDGVENPQTGKPYTKAEMKDLFDKLYEYNKTTGAIPGGPGRSTTGRFMLGENVTASNETGEKLTSAQEWTAKFVSEVMAEKGYVTDVVFTRQEGADGQMLNGVLYLNPDTLNDYFALQTTLFHELFHRGREGEKANNAEMDEKLNDGKIHSGMIESVLANFQEFARWGFFGDEGRRHFVDPKAQIEAVREKYKTYFSSRINPGTGAVYTPAELDSLLTETYCAEEVAANWLGAALANENALTKMAGVSPSTVSTILEKVQSLKSRLRGDQLSKDARMMRKAIDEMEAELYEALDVASQLPASIDEGTVRAKVKGMSWEDQIDAVLDLQKTKSDGTYDWNADQVRGSALYIPETPKRLLDIGLSKVPMAYTQKHLLTAMLSENVDDNGHALRGGYGISADVLKRLPKLISSPVMLIASPTVPGDVIVVTSEVSERGWPIVASIHPSANGGTAVIDGSVTAANFITSVYPREDFDVTIKDAGQKRDSFVSRAASDGRILWADKEGFDALMAALDEKRSQITGWATRTEGPGISSIGIDFNKIIRQVKPVVKGRKSEGRFKLTGDAFGAPLSAQTQEYFKDSVARVGYTTDGALLRWYRRLNDNSGVIDPAKSQIGTGVFWTSDPDITERGARTDATTEETPVMEEFKPAMVECYLNLTNPLILDCQGRRWNNLGDLSEYGNSTDAIATSVYNNTDYDGVILTNIRGGSGIIADDAIQFFPDQSKGTANNSPTYSPDFRFKLSDDTDYEEFFDTDYAPTFYSKLERVTQKMKQEKIDANSYLSMLKGKGVKDEEIKWSGVGQFLAEHPKTTKTELLDFFDENSLNIDVTTLDDIDPETGLNIREAEEDGGDFAIGETPAWAEDDEWMPEGPPPGFESSEYDDDDTYRTEWSGYKLRSGENYREYVFTMRGSEYSNPAMRTHWKSRTGVLVHARVQDFVEATGKKVLYIEEIQSDWHNAGQKHGYRGEYSPEIQQLLGQRDALENDYSAMDEYERADTYGRYVADEYERVTTELQDADVNLESAPDAPFKGKGYTDYALKYLIREAAAGGYDYVAWSPAFFQDIRWDDHREHESDKGVSGNLKGYAIEYDQDIPNFLRKYGKQWNAGLSKVLMGVEYEDLSIEDALEMAEDVYNVQEENYEIGYVDEDDDIMYAVPALEVNDAMRESVLYDGQPRFKVSDAEGEKISRAAFDAMRSRFALADSQDFLDFLTARYTNRSEVRTNTFEYSGIFTEAEKRLEGMREEDFNYNVESERQSMERARERLDADYMAEKQHLMLDDTSWSGEDLDTAMGILTAELDIARKTNAPNAYDEVSDWMHRIAQMGTKAGQMIQAFAKYTRTPEGVLVRAAKDLRQTKLTPQQRTELLDRIRQFANTLCALRDGDKQGIIDLIVEQAKQRKTPVSKSTMTALQKQNYQYLYGTALAQLDQIAKDYIPKSGGRKIATYQTMAHLLNLRTGERNIGSNVVFNLIDTVANDISMVPDLVLSAFTGRRMVGFESTLSKARKEGSAAARSKAHVEIALDVAPESSQDKYGTARRTWKMVGGVGSKVMSTLERTMGYELNWTDESTKGGVRAMVMKSLEPAIAQGWITKADAEAMAEQEALYRTFQDETYIGQFLALTKKAFNVFGFGGKGALNHEFGLGDLVIKYTQVPGALITRAIEFSPVGMAKAVWNLHQFNQSNRAVRRARNNLDEITAEWESRGNGKDGKPLIESTRAQNEIRNAQKELALAIQNTNVNQRRAALQIGRTMTGTGLITLFAACALRGVLRRPDDDEDANLKALHSAQGLSGTQFNLSAMMRMFQGESTEWEDGDVLADADFLEPTNALMTMGSLVANSDECQTVWDMFKNPNVLFNKATMNALYHSIGELSVMQTLSTIQNAMTYYDPESPLEEWQTIAIDVARSSMTGFIPAPVRQVATALDPYYRDTYIDTSEWGLTRAQAMNSIPGLREDLPEKLTNYGTPKEQEQNPWLRAANALAVPGSIRTYQQSDLTDELDRLADATGKATFVPARNAPYSDTFDDEKFELTPEQRQRYQTIRGRTTVEMMNAVMDDPLYKSASATDQAAMLNDARNYANYLARKDLASSLGTEYSSSTYEAWAKAMDNGISLPAYNTISPMLSTGDSSPFHGDDRKDQIVDYLSDCVLNGTLSTEGANFLFAKAYESYRLKDNDGKRTDEYDWNKLSGLPWNG